MSSDTASDTGTSPGIDPGGRREHERGPDGTDGATFPLIAQVAADLIDLIAICVVAGVAGAATYAAAMAASNPNDAWAELGAALVAMAAGALALAVTASLVAALAGRTGASPGARAVGLTVTRQPPSHTSARPGMWRTLGATVARWMQLTAGVYALFATAVLTRSPGTVLPAAAAGVAAAVGTSLLCLAYLPTSSGQPWANRVVSLQAHSRRAGRRWPNAGRTAAVVAAVAVATAVAASVAIPNRALWPHEARAHVSDVATDHVEQIGVPVPCEHADEGLSDACTAPTSTWMLAGSGDARAVAEQLADVIADEGLPQGQVLHVDVEPHQVDGGLVWTVQIRPELHYSTVPDVVAAVFDGDGHGPAAREPATGQTIDGETVAVWITGPARASTVHDLDRALDR